MVAPEWTADTSMGVRVDYSKDYQRHLTPRTIGSNRTPKKSSFHANLDTDRLKTIHTHVHGQYLYSQKYWRVHKRDNNRSGAWRFRTKFGFERTLWRLWWKNWNEKIVRPNDDQMSTKKEKKRSRNFDTKSWHDTKFEHRYRIKRQVNSVFRKNFTLTNRI